MDVGFIFRSSISIWDTDENEKVKIGIKMCRDPLVVPIYGCCGMENCILVLTKVVNEECEQQKYFV
jgi:hypothetical protein